MDGGMTHYEAQHRMDRAARRHLIDTLRKVKSDQLAADLEASDIEVKGYIENGK